MIIRIFLLLAGAGVTVAYFLTPPAKGFAKPDLAKILFFHVPPAMLCSVFFLWGAVMGARYLITRNITFDHRSLAAIEIGFILCVLATLTGMIFAKAQWGAFWEWDPRQTSILIQLMIYASYFALRHGFDDRERMSKVSASFAIFAFASVPFLIWALPRIPAIANMSKHAGANQAVIGGGLDSTYRLTFYLSLVVIFLAFSYAYQLRARQADESYQKELEHERDSDAGTSTGARVVEPVSLHIND